MRNTATGTHAHTYRTTSPALTHGPRRRIGHQAAAQPSPLTILKAIVLETMDYPPVRPTSADSFLPAPLLDAAKRAVKVAECRGTLAHSLTAYRIIRRLAGPALAFRLSFGRA